MCHLFLVLNCTSPSFPPHFSFPPSSVVVFFPGPQVSSTHSSFLLSIFSSTEYFPFRFPCHSFTFLRRPCRTAGDLVSPLQQVHPPCHLELSLFVSNNLSCHQHHELQWGLHWLTLGLSAAHHSPPRFVFISFANLVAMQIFDSKWLKLNFS